MSSDQQLEHKEGIEKWAENYLAGKHGGELYVINPTTGAIVTKVGESAPKAADSVYLTIDRNLQYYAEQSIKGFTGAVVVLERDTGRVLAMATSPGYDSNTFAADNPNGSSEYSELLQSYSRLRLPTVWIAPPPFGSRAFYLWFQGSPFAPRRSRPEWPCRTPSVSHDTSGPDRTS